MSTPRRYRSSLRESQARETRGRIREAARVLFVANGFSETTVTEIADSAGVAPQTVYSAFGSKGAIVAAMLEDLEEKAEAGERIAGVIAEQDPHKQLRLFAAWIRTLFERGAPVLVAAFEAYGDPDVAAFTERGDENRRRGTKQLTRIWTEKGALRGDLDEREAADCLWLLTSAQTYMLSIDGLGWSPDQYERWLVDVLERELMASPRA
jgi:AcrR family transcriptional regulator